MKSVQNNLLQTINSKRFSRKSCSTNRVAIKPRYLLDQKGGRITKKPVPIYKYTILLGPDCDSLHTQHTCSFEMYFVMFAKVGQRMGTKICY
jgi:hypothetical protein